MPFVPAICTQCGAPIVVDDTKEAGICNHCGTAFITEKAIYNYNYVNNITNVSNTNNTYNVQDSEVHIHNAYDDAETLYKNICAQLENGYTGNDEAVLNNLRTMEEKFPADSRLLNAKWLVRKDEAALMKTYSTDREFFLKHAYAIRNEDNILQLRLLDRPSFEKTYKYLTTYEKWKHLIDQEPLLQERYLETVVKEGNEYAKKSIGCTCTGDMHDAKRGVYNYLDTFKGYTTRSSIVLPREEIQSLMLGVLQVKEYFVKHEYGVDEAYIMGLLKWFINTFSKDEGYARLLKGGYPILDIAIEANKLLPAAKRQALFVGESARVRERLVACHQWYLVTKKLTVEDDKYCVKAARDALLANTVLSGLSFFKQLDAENFKTGLFGVKFIGSDKTFSLDSFVERISRV